MYDEKDEQAGAQKNKFMASHGIETPEIVHENSRPIAELYPAATVFFADIA
jgi:hypothetical protein